MKREKAIVIVAAISAIIVLVGMVLVAKKMNDDRKSIIDQVLYGDPISSTNAALPDPNETKEVEKTAEQSYLEWQVYQLLTDSIENKSLRVSPSQIRCSERSENGCYIVFGMYYVGTESHSITVYYESESDGSVFDADAFNIYQVFVDSEKVFPDEG